MLAGAVKMRRSSHGYPLDIKSNQGKLTMSDTPILVIGANGNAILSGGTAE